MKKLIYLCMALVMMVAVSCEKDEVGGTATQSLAGEWVVKVSLVDADGSVIKEDPYGMGKFTINTYNTAANTANEMWVDDKENFWAFKVKVPANPDAQTFGSGVAVKNTIVTTPQGGDPYYCDVTISGGKVLNMAGRQNNGSAADSIAFYVSFSDDDEGTRYLISGVRYSGLVENQTN